MQNHDAIHFLISRPTINGPWSMAMLVITIGYNGNITGCNLWISMGYKYIIPNYTNQHDMSVCLEMAG